jgi:hypothetical protein
MASSYDGGQEVNGSEDELLAVGKLQMREKLSEKVCVELLQVVLHVLIGSDEALKQRTHY